MANKIYFTYNGIKCYGYDVYFPGSGHNEVDDQVYIGVPEYTSLCAADISDFAPKVDVKPGSSLHIVPPCDVALDDIRREYKIKRKFDDADFNVFSSADRWSTIWTYTDGVIIDHVNKKVYIKIYGITDIYQYAVKDGADISTCTLVHPQMQFMRLPPFECGKPWKALILGTATKPCISIKDLKFEACNELDIDALMLVYRLDKDDRYVNSDDIDKFNLQLKSLNQTNWREYPLTINMLFNELLFYKSNGTYRYCKGRISTIPKAIKHFYSQVKKPDTYTKKDLDMAKAFLMNLLDMKEVMYVSSSALAAKLQKINMLPEYFEQYFDCVVRIKSKDYVEN